MPHTPLSPQSSVLSPPLIPSRPRAFTLIELLVVIGIIVVLMGILIPVAGRVRQTAYTTSTHSQLLVIQQGIEAYRQVFESYPGPISEKMLLPATNPANEGGPLTSSENLVLGLLGGLKNTTVPPAFPIFKFDPLLVGAGPASLNVFKAQRYQAFTDATSAGLDTIKVSNAWVPWKDPAHANVSNPLNYTDTALPEFVDRFPDALPILYIRAKVGANGAVTDGATAYPTGSIPAYDRRQLEPYSFPKLPMGTPTGSPVPGGFALYAAEYFGNTADPRTPRQKDGYLLISAGIDRLFGTIDDVTSAGKVK